MGLPGVKIGPLDPDATEAFGRVAAQNSARTLLRLHMQAHPAELTRALARKLDAERTRTLDLEEVRDYLAGQKLENGDPVVPEGCEVRAATIRGERDRPQVLTFVYETESGRSGKWFVPYDSSALPASTEAGDEAIAVEEARKRGIVFGHEGHEAERQRRLASQLRRENDALRSRIEHPEDLELSDSAADVRSDEAIVEEVELLRREREELVQRVASLEGALENAGVGRLAEAGERARERAQAGQDALAADEPVEGYDELNADKAIKLLRDDKTPAEERRGILEYERSHANRKSVIAAGESALRG